MSNSGRSYFTIQGCAVLIAVVAVALTTARLTWQKPPGQVVFFVSHTILPPAVLPYHLATAVGHPNSKSFRGVAFYIGIPASVVALASLALWLLVAETFPTIGLG